MYTPKREVIRKIQSERPPPYELSELLLHNTMFYILPPLCEVPLNEVEELARDRLKMLRIFESATAKYPNKYSDDWKESILRELKGAGLKSFVRLLQGNGNTPADLEARRKDYLSHFILRFPYCRTSELRRWFLSREMEVFWFKFKNLTAKDVLAFKKAYDLSMEPVSQEEKMSVQEGLMDSLPEKGHFRVEDMDFYKVKFTEVLDLVGKRKCFLKAGYAYVSASDFGHIIAPKFEKFIERGLDEHLEILPLVENDERLTEIIRDLHTSYTGKDYSVGTNEVAIENLDQLSKKSYPLCMRMCHDSLRATHKLKHNGRMQYQLFLKGIGVTLEDCIRFFREEFNRILDGDKFEKQYVYNIRHNYGKEGSRINYAPHSCMKIINTNSISADDVHGCPFRLYNPVDLKAKLTKYGLGQVHTDEVAELAKNGHYQLACQRYFEVVHDTKLMEGINHPNRYFELSQEVMGKRVPKAATSSAKEGSKTRKINRDLVLKKKKLEGLLDEDTEQLIAVSQITEARLREEKKKEDPNDDPLNKTAWDKEDDDDFYSQFDDSIAMQY